MAAITSAMVKELRERTSAAKRPWSRATEIWTRPLNGCVKRD